MFIFFHNNISQSFLDIGFLLQRTTDQCYRFFQCPFQQVQKGKQYIEISQPALSNR